MDRRTLLTSAAATAGAGVVAAGLGAGSASAAPSVGTTRHRSAGIRSITALTEVYGDGQKLIAVAVEYDRPIRSARLSVDTFTVVDRTVTKVYAHHRPEVTDHPSNGRYAIVELSLDDDAAALFVAASNGGGGMPTVGDTTPAGSVLEPSATVVQALAVQAVDGTRYPAESTERTTDGSINPIFDDFKQFTYSDPVNGQSLPYNLFVPQGYRKGARYPLVLFMHDAGEVNSGVKAPLAQGLGAICWASPRDQAKHPAFVLAPDFGAIVVDDDYEPMNLFDTALRMLEDVVSRYGVDRSRIYTTGQSMGAMLSLGMNIAHPNLFAAAYIVAGQWPADQAEPLAGKNLWIVVSQGDTKAYPGENEITAVIEAAGTEVTTATWDGGASQREFAADVRAMERAGTSVNYASFTPGTVTTDTSGGSEHTGTWKVAYSIPGVRDWIMRQRL
ncbi:MAG: hypothetical protein QM638_03795 [Nocardioides sp.]|uniref:hypothetical protein n=1 Tax=Nocardioides sp. TaxID=35761 RepID=UPI0039E2613D